MLHTHRRNGNESTGRFFFLQTSLDMIKVLIHFLICATFTALSCLSASGEPLTREQIKRYLEHEEVSELAEKINHLDVDSKKEAIQEVVDLTNQYFPASKDSSAGIEKRFFLMGVGVLSLTIKDKTLVSLLEPYLGAGNFDTECGILEGLISNPSPEALRLVVQVIEKGLNEGPATIATPKDRDEERKMKGSTLAFIGYIEFLCRSPLPASKAEAARLIGELKSKYQHDPIGGKMAEYLEFELKKYAGDVPVSVPSNSFVNWPLCTGIAIAVLAAGAATWKFLRKRALK